MEWLLDNWVLVLFGGGMIAMHMFGHGGHGKNGGHGGHACCKSRTAKAELTWTSGMRFRITSPLVGSGASSSRSQWFLLVRSRPLPFGCVVILEHCST